MKWRKSWAYENIYGKKGDSQCTKRSLLPDERSVWDDYLDLAALNIIPGQISISPTCGYTPEQLAELLKTPADTIKRTNKKLQDMESILIQNNGIIVILNWKNYQTEAERIKQYTEDNTEEHTPEHTRKHTPQSKRRIDKEKKYIRKEYKNIYTKLFERWNAKNIIKHKYLTDAAYGTINRCIDNGYKLEELLQAINNYAFIVKDRRFFWTHRWTLQEFLQRGLDKFMNLANAKQNYRDRKVDLEREEIESTKREMRSK